MCTRRRTREAPVGDGNRANDAQLGMPTGQQQGSAQEKYRACLIWANSVARAPHMQAADV